MKTKVILLALFLCIGIWSCNKNKENPLQEEKLIQKNDSTKKTKDCFKSYNEKLLKKHFWLEGVVKYSDFYKEYVVVYKGDNPEWFSTEHLFCPNLEPKFCKEGLRVKVRGEHYRGAELSKDGSKPQGGVYFPVYRFRNYRITEIK